MRSCKKILFIGPLLILIYPSLINACQLVYASPILEPHFWEEENKAKGLSVDFLNLVAQKANCDIQYQAKPWKRVMHEMRSGKVDLTIGFYAKEREEFARYSQAKFGEYNFYIFTKPSVEPVKSIKDLYAKNKNLLYPKNWYLGKLKSEIQSSKELAVPFVAIQDGINLLINNRADALLSPTTNALYSFKKMSLTNKFVMNSPQLESLAQYLMFSKSSVSDEIYQRINSAMIDIVEAGDMDKITKSYTHSE